MVLRVTIDSGATVVVGLLDEAALADVIARCRATSARRLVLRAGTIVRAECMATLAGLDLEVVAESPYLARWLERARRPEEPVTIADQARLGEERQP